MKLTKLHAASFLLFFSVLSANSQTLEILPGLENEYNTINPHNLVVFDAEFIPNAMVQSGQLTYLEGEENTAHLIATFVDLDDTLSGWELELYLTDGLNWEEWSNQDFPTSYKDNSGTVTDEFLDWQYYLISCGTLTGTGQRTGSIMQLSHSPINFFYAFEIGENCNGWNSGFGGDVWAESFGSVYSPELQEFVNTAPSLSFHFDINPTPLEDQVTDDLCSSFSAGEDISMCFSCGEAVQLNPYIPCFQGGTGQWSVLTGSGQLSNPLDPQASYIVESAGYSELVLTIECEGQMLSDTLSINVFSDPVPSSEECINCSYYVNYCQADSIDLSQQLNSIFFGNLQEGFWTQDEGCPVDISESNNQFPTIHGLQPGEYHFYWSETIDPCGCGVLPQVSLTVEGCEEGVEDCETISEICSEYSAGEDLAGCDLCGNDFQLLATAPDSLTGVWSVLSGFGTFSDINDPNAVFSPALGINQLEWTYSCLGNQFSDTVEVHYYSAYPLPPNAGEDIIISYCEADSVMLDGNASYFPSENYWELVEGCPVEFSDANDPNAIINGLIPGQYEFTWNHTFQCNCFLVFSDTLLVTVEGCDEIVEDCEVLQTGCSLEFATNFNPEADLDDGLCEFDFTVCDCSGNMQSPYVYLQLGNGIINNSDSLNFDCELWGFDCGDIDDSGESDICESALMPNYGCSDYVQSQKYENELAVYPNPASSSFTVQVDNSAQSIELFTSSGALVRTYSIVSSSNVIEIDISNFPPGIYSLKYGTKTEKLVIER